MKQNVIKSKVTRQEKKALHEAIFVYCFTLCTNSDSETQLCHGQQKDNTDDETLVVKF